jgi:hypothetical protein
MRSKRVRAQSGSLARTSAWRRRRSSGLIEDNPGTFAIRTPNLADHLRAVSLLRDYRDRGFSYVDALCFAAIDSDPEIGRVLTVDGRDFRTNRFAHTVEVVLPKT